MIKPKLGLAKLRISTNAQQSQILECKQNVGQLLWHLENVFLVYLWVFVFCQSHQKENNPKQSQTTPTPKSTSIFTCLNTGSRTGSGINMYHGDVQLHRLVNVKQTHCKLCLLTRLFSEIPWVRVKTCRFLAFLQCKSIV